MRCFFNKNFFALFLLVNQVGFGVQIPQERKLYVGTNSTEAVMNFDAQVEFRSEGRPTKEVVAEQLENQVNHLFGPMGVATYRAVPKGDHVFTAISPASLKSGTRGTYLVNYHYQGTIVLQNGPRTQYEVMLPINPDAIYEASGKTHGKNPCTDDHYNSEGDFWYFWNPYNSGCRLQENVDFVKINTAVTRLENTKKTYPEYERLIRDLNHKKAIVISVMMGMDDPDANDHNPLKSRDINASNYRDIRKTLLRMGFTVSAPWTAGEVDALVGHKVKEKVFVEELKLSTKKADLLVRMSFGASGMGEKSEGFHWLYKDALENSSVMIYDGHSGLGDHLDLKQMEEAEGYKINFDRNSYQILYFNSCSSYTYYNTQYFARKVTSSDARGTKNLDILTNGLATYFSVMHDTNLRLVKAIVDWSNDKATTSYQVLAKEIDSQNLFGINGDEDNPTN